MTQDQPAPVLILPDPSLANAYFKALPAEHAPSFSLDGTESCAALLLSEANSIYPWTACVFYRFRKLPDELQVEGRCTHYLWIEHWEYRTDNSENDASSCTEDFYQLFRYLLFAVIPKPYWPTTVLTLSSQRPLISQCIQGCLRASQGTWETMDSARVLKSAARRFHAYQHFIKTHELIVPESNGGAEEGADVSLSLVAVAHDDMNTTAQEAQNNASNHEAWKGSRFLFATTLVHDKESEAHVFLFPANSDYQHGRRGYGRRQYGNYSRGGGNVFDKQVHWKKNKKTLYMPLKPREFGGGRSTASSRDSSDSLPVPTVAVYFLSSILILTGFSLKYWKMK